MESAAKQVKEATPSTSKILLAATNVSSPEEPSSKNE
jgi:hypothetical protein